MARKSTELKAVSYISIGGSPPVRFDSLSPEKRAECTAKMAENIGNVLSRYLSENPQEAASLLSAQK